MISDKTISSSHCLKLAVCLKLWRAYIVFHWNNDFGFGIWNSRSNLITILHLQIHLLVCKCMSARENIFLFYAECEYHYNKRKFARIKIFYNVLIFLILRLQNADTSTPVVIPITFLFVSFKRTFKKLDAFIKTVIPDIRWHFFRLKYIFV